MQIPLHDIAIYLGKLCFCKACYLRKLREPLEEKQDAKGRYWHCHNCGIVKRETED